MLKSLALLLLLTGQTEPPNVPATQPNADYPLQIRILQTKWNHTLGDYQGFGRADLLGADPRGIEFTFECSQPFMANPQRGEFYQAKWKKPDKELELFVQRVGSDHTSKCTLKTSMKAAPFSNMSAGWLKPLPPPASRPPAAAATPPPPR